MTVWKREPAKCGTNSGYIAHALRGDIKRWRTDSRLRCLPCLDAHAAYNRAYEATRRQLKLAAAARATTRRRAA